MKQFLVFGIFILVITSSKAQVKIGGTPAAPDPSAILEMDGGTTRGLLLPRMLKANMLSIQDPAEGLTLYVTDEQATYLRRQNNWVKLSGAGNPFSLPYTGTFSEGTAPVLSLTNSANGGTAINGASILGAGTGVHGYAYHSNGYGIKGTGIFARGGYFNSRNSHALITDTGRVGLGTLSPAAFLEIDATKNDATSTVIINDNINPFIQLQNNGVNKGYLLADGDDMVLAPNTNNTAGRVVLRTGNVDRLFVDDNGNTGVGSPSVSSRLLVDATGTPATAMVINDQNPTLQFQNNGENKGTLQLNGDDIRLGTNVANTPGNIVFRTKGFDRIFIDSNGHMSFGDAYRFGAMLNVMAPTNLGKANIELQSDYNSSYGPEIRFTGRSPVNTTLGYIKTNADYMDFKSGITSANGYRFRCADNEYLRINGANGHTTIAERLGISTYSPVSLLHVDGYRNGGDNMIIGEIARFQGFNPIIQFQNVTQNTGFLQVSGSDFKMGTNAGITGDVVLRTNGVDRVFVASNGNVQIGGDGFNGPPGGSHKLAVKGRIAASEFDVVAVSDWADYVFDPSYNLRSLEETEAYIKANKHLPNIPAASVVEKDGYGLADMQKRMMEKIEELTLYLIESKKEITKLKAQVKALQAKN